MNKDFKIVIVLYIAAIINIISMFIAFNTSYVYLAILIYFINLIVFGSYCNRFKNQAL